MNIQYVNHHFRFSLYTAPITIYLSIYLETRTRVYSPVDCDLRALPTKLWLTGCYRSHLCPLTMCKILDICVHIKSGLMERGYGGSGVSTSSVDRGLAGWMRAVRRSGHHLIKTLAAHLCQLDFCLRLPLRLRNLEWSGSEFVWNFVLYHTWVERMCGGFSACRYLFLRGPFPAHWHAGIHICTHSAATGK